MSQVRTIRLYGKLGAKFGRVFKLAVSSPAEAVRALCAQLPGFESYLMKGKDRGEGYSVFVGKRNLSEEELQAPSGSDDIRIAPILLGSKNGGIFQVILGAVLVVVGVAIGVGSGGTAGVVASALVGMGVSMMVGGVVQLLTGTQGTRDRERPENQPSHTFNGAVNTQAQGHPVPLQYGEMIVGSAVISAGISVEDMFAPAASSGSGVGPGGFNPSWPQLPL